jgi:hypothetical protein
MSASASSRVMTDKVTSLPRYARERLPKLFQP